MTLDELKAELNIDHDQDDAILTRKLGEAQAFAEAWLGKPLAEFDPLPATITGAVLRLAAHFYDTGDGIPEGVTEKLLAHRVWKF